jgi:uncharacterized membrane protein
MRRVLLALPLLFVPSMGCDDTLFEGAQEGPVEGTPGFAGVQAIVDAHCLGCHGAESALGDLDLETDLHGAIVGVTGDWGMVIVEPGDLDNSLFYLKTTNQQGANGSDMPIGTGGLSQPENETIANWILDGAPAE